MYLKPSKHQPGKLYGTATVYNNKKIQSGKSYAADVCNKSQFHPDVVILKMKEKNGHHWLKPILDSIFPDGLPANNVNPGNVPVHHNAVYKIDEGTRVPLGPKGGNDIIHSETPGEPGQGPTKTSIAMACATVAIDGYKQFVEGKKNNTVFTLFIPCTWFTEPNDHRHGHNLICLGTWYYDKLAQTTDIENCGDHAMTNNDNTKKKYCAI